ncbi:MAG: Eco57I restriction-modification methylase domain-containing protein, partial [Anaerovoracaceae bacterium]
MSNLFKTSFEYKLIYIFRINDEKHKGLLKIGDATIKTEESVDRLPPNCKLLNQAAKDRIKQYTNTAGITAELLHTELAIHTVKDKMTGQPTLKAFRDHDVHAVLENSGFAKHIIKGSTSREWFEIDLEISLKAIDAVKKNLANLSNSTVKGAVPIIFRPEQEQAIKQTLEQFKHNNKILWNAKMRFGKTLSALEVTRKSKFAKTIIITHRPVVDNGWYEDFGKIFYNEKDYIYGSKSTGYTLEQLIQTKKKFVYFASIQDLRGSDAVGGKFNKNDVAFSLNWDLVIVDEAHEGTTTALGDAVIENIVKDGNGYDTKFLALSGTPFNILDKYEDNVYTWDYIMEQQAKKEWDELHFGDSNPYDELPQLKIFTYDLGKLVAGEKYVEIEDKAFNFREFFRVWTGDMAVDRTPMPIGKSVGDFYHEDDIKSFLNLITRADEDSHYPYATEEYRSLFKHALWMVPGVKEAKALSKLLKQHSVFGSGVFDVVNVAGDGDEEEKTDDALKKVQKAISDAGEDGYTITLSCGKLTTGVTVPEWNAVFMLSGSFSTSAANYLQTIFRVQSPCNKNGKIKQFCYVFDFAPDRTLKMVAESVAISTKAGKADTNDRAILGEFLNYCPVISLDGTEMKKYDTGRLLQQLKHAYADRAVKNGFDDNSLYNDELLKLDEIDLTNFSNLKKIVGASKAAPKSKDIDINNQGLTDEEYEKLKKIEKKQPKQRTSEDEEYLAKIKEQQKQKNTAISILRGISIRMPLLIYGADIDIKDDFTLDMFLDDKIVDPDSWNEFMPTGVTKELFKEFTRYYDPEIFVSAGRKIRNTVKSADELLPTERVQKISELFTCFKNPDKETVLTPWRVVNMHMGDCLGGYDFFNEEHSETLKEPRFVDQGKVTAETFGNSKAQILEINSKTGLYPLYVTYSIFRNKCEPYKKDELTADLQEKLWNETVEKNIFVICKTPMAKSITKRTLVGFKDVKVNSHAFDDLIGMLKDKPQQFVERVLRTSFWDKKGSEKMKFDAVVGNPPYQMSDGSGGTNDAPIYQYFVESAQKITARYASLIMPSRWFTTGRENLLGDFRNHMLNNTSIRKLYAF